MNKILYLSDLSLPNKSAYAVHVMKMCDAFAKNKNVDLIVNDCSCSWGEIKKNYSLENNFKIMALNNIKVRSIIFRIFNAYKTLKIAKNFRYKFIISRNIFSSIFLAYFGKKNILEVHTELTGLTKNIFFFLKKVIQKNLKFIFIHKELKKYLKIYDNFIVLDDSINLREFNCVKKKAVKNKFVYTGSYLKGKGIEIIINLAKYFKKYEFHTYGNIDTFPKDIKKKIGKINNLYINDFITYDKIPKVIKSAEYLLMPYPSKIEVLIKDLDVKEYISPLKMFEYLAAKRIIFASYQKSYNHILVDNFNAVLIKKNSITEWKKRIKQVVANKNKYTILKKNSYETAKKFTWKKRAFKITKFANE